MIPRTGKPTVMLAMRLRFFTSPHACPSGVSAGHTIPQCVLCSMRGVASFPDRSIGVLSRRRWESAEV